ncbi:hypothetical protein DPMN_061731 [Dreissena polymorpha]|uniref:Uncharacterized protein n=1 Tax=Dreissena polymorpha TaxID=45954 RepID=A0A9D4C8C4_DREPO|nr:hypothetical protein DPMN_061731 [Dreissena polymorpha]
MDKITTGFTNCFICCIYSTVYIRERSNSCIYCTVYIRERSNSCIYSTVYIREEQLYLFHGLHQRGAAVSIPRSTSERGSCADHSSIFFLKVKGLSFSITKEGGVE